MAKTRVKICGITNWTDARRAFEAGADFLGFNFYSGSPRYISPAQAGKIVKRLPEGVAAVGVFVNETEDAVIEVARRLKLDFVQLHGEETPATVAKIAMYVPVIKALRVRKPFRVAQLQRFKCASAFLLDGFDRRARGGTGKTFDWTVARRVKRGRNIFLAGGLSPENVAEAQKSVTPYALDVCSGVEARPGKKDAARIKAFMRAVRNGKMRTR
ncbi:MAG TPA: phosphoribosylanthranilate isomerase [Candidatus Acidoferrales bacterium]